jgi:hypothetical protein
LENARIYPAEDEHNTGRLMLREHLIKLVEAMTKKESLINCEISLVISCLSTGVARVLRMKVSEPIIGWKGEHPQIVHW